MKDVSIPLPDSMDRQIAEIEVKINGKNRQYDFRVKSFRWEPDDKAWDVEKKIKMLQDTLQQYENPWEPIRIFRPRESSKFKQVLHMQRHPVSAMS